ncbi:helix-turn-helix domain-containing protein [Salinispora arenicola]|uniref:HTH cro/C1-type domain-containing protein n=1 Tax=Salinispora arenicola (strain CNS-205) TaxID=391037 RepID=A8M8D7_SALAI|nr:helix-turn-helix domain-containing protein [Salinispora arenicola]
MAIKDESGATSPTLQDKINMLVALPLPHEHVSGISDSPDSIGERIKVIAKAAGISDSLLNALRLGRRDNPTKVTMQRLADLYDIDPAYFTDGPLGTEIYRQLQLLQTMAEIKKAYTPQLKIAFRDHFGLSARGADAALQILEQLRDLEAGGGSREP